MKTNGYADMMRRAGRNQACYLCCLGVLLAGIFLSCAYPVCAQQISAMEIEQSGTQPPVQMGRPIVSWWDVTLRTTGVMEGQLEFSLYNDTRHLITTTTENLALTGPKQRIRVMLPPVDDVITVDQLRVDIRFRGKRLTQDLGSHILRLALTRMKSYMMMLGVSRLGPKRTPERDRLIHQLCFEDLAPKDFDEQIKTVVISTDPSDFSQEPLAYCGYDLIVLFEDEFRQLKKGQLESILAWVRAGGCLYVEPGGVLESYHVEFLRQLASADPREPVFQPDSHGRLIPGTIYEDERLFLVSNSLGRAVIRVDDAPADSGSLVWRQATAFLWRVQADKVKLAGEQSSTELLDLLPYGWHPAFDGNGNIVQRAGHQTFGFPAPPGGQLMPQPIPQPMPRPTTRPGMPLGWVGFVIPTSTSELVDHLMPEGVQMVPLWVLGVILSTFVLVIGPIDYFVLGRFRARKYTWVTFPLATILVTAFTVWITNRYMSSAETRRALIVRDLGDDGATVRTNRFELLFVASSRQAETEVHKGLFSSLSGKKVVDEFGNPIPQGMVRPGTRYGVSYGPNGNPYRNPYGNVPLESSDRTPDKVSGRIPTEFAVTQQMAKWTPQLNRVFSLPGPVDDEKIDWKSLISDTPGPEMFTSHQVPLELIARIRTKFGGQAMVACLGSNGRWAYDGSANWGGRFAPVPQGYPSYVAANYWDAQLPNDILQKPELFRWLYQHSVALPRGLFGLVYKTAPMGGPHLTDMVLLDASDDKVMLLIVLVPSGEDIVAYRKLLRVAK